MRLQSNLIDGEGQRNAYWQLFADHAGHIHVSWVWSESPDVRSNHDMCYAVSTDGGLSWKKSTGESYQLPITESTGEVVKVIPQGSSLINQTSMTVDQQGNPYIATYFKADGDSCTQFHVIYKQNGMWKSSVATTRTLDFELGGVGSRSIPVSRPQLVVLSNEKEQQLALIYRDEEVDNHVVMASTTISEAFNWNSQIISPFSVDRWEPSYHAEFLRRNIMLHLYYQKVGQGQGETSVALEPQMVKILEINPKDSFQKTQE